MEEKIGSFYKFFLIDRDIRRVNLVITNKLINWSPFGLKGLISYSNGKIKIDLRFDWKLFFKSICSNDLMVKVPENLIKFFLLYL